MSGCTSIRFSPCHDGSSKKAKMRLAGHTRLLSPMAAVAQSVGTKFLIIGISAANGVITARELLPAGRGDLAAMILWPVFLASAMTLGIPSALTFQLRSHPEQRSQLMGAGLLLALLTSGLAMLVGALFMDHWIAQYPPKAILFAQFFLLGTPLTSLLLVGRAGLESGGDFLASNKLQVYAPALTFAALLVLLASHS